MRTDQKLFCLKTILIIFLSLLWLIAAAIFGVLLWLRLDFWTNEYLELDDDLHRYLILVYIALSAGGLLVLFSIFGLIGGCIKKKWLLIVYLISIVLAMLLTIAAVVYGVLYREELKETLLHSDFLSKVIQKKYVYHKGTSNQMYRINRVVNIMQRELNCCGGEGPRDFIDSTWLNGLQLAEPDATAKSIKFVPYSCCKTSLNYDNDQPCKLYELNTEQTLNPDIWHAGCKTALQEFLDEYIMVVIIIAGIFFLLQFIAMIFTSILIHVLNSLYVPQPDDIVYDMAHNQEKSPYPSRGDYRDYYH